MKLMAAVLVAVAVLGGCASRAGAQSTTVATEYLMTYMAPINAQRLSIDATTAITNVLPGGWVEGPRIRGTLIPPGGDWVTLMPDGVTRLDARAVIQTDDGALIYMTYRGIVVASKAVADTLARGEVVTDKTMPYFMTAPIFQTSSEKYAWLNKIQAVGKMVEYKRGGDDSYVKYDVFVVK